MQKAKEQITKIHKTNIIKHETRQELRLNKYISDSGFCSRRQADILIAEKKVIVDGNIASLGTKVNDKSIVSINNKVIKPKTNKVYIMLNKPKGITCTNDLSIKGNIREYVDYEELIFPIGRLDKDSTGLILLTNDGDIVNKILRAKYGHEKEYIVNVDNPITDHFIKMMSEGITIFNDVTSKYQKTDKALVTKIDNHQFKIVLKQGLNRQIRRMTEALGYHVLKLKRIRIMNILLGDLKVGMWRYLTNEELEDLNKNINKNTN